MTHRIAHIELSSADNKAMADFYSAIFGWKMTEFPEVNYTTFSWGDEENGGGFNPIQEGNPAGTVVAYVHTDDINASVAKIEAQGGTILLPPMEVPGTGLIAQFTDPTGNRMGLYQPLPRG